MKNDFSTVLKINLSESRKLHVYESLSAGSDPRGSFFFLVGVSTMIAAFGLVMNSTAVVIGAMLVAPLMTPILGLGLALVRGDTHLLGIASRSEAAGIVVAIGASMLLGIVVPYFDPTPEMLSRTEPNLFDLLVAVFAGLAGAYALVNERLSPVLPGVAISTAIVPPLANVGLSLSLGAFQGAWGSFLLFFTNFLSILLVSSLIFYLAGMATEIKTGRGVMLARRFGIASVGFLVIAALLSGELIGILEHRRIANDVRESLKVELAAFAVSDMKRLLHKDEGERILVLAEVNGPKEVTPRQVARIQERISATIGKQVQLYLRTTITHDVSAEGAIAQTAIETLDGFYSPTKPSAQVQRVQLAEQVVREFLDTVFGIRLANIDSVPAKDYAIIVATIDGIRTLYPNEISVIEKRIQERLGEPRIWFVVNQRLSNIKDYVGGLRPEIMDFGELDWETLRESDEFWVSARQWLAERSFWLENWTGSVLDGVYVLVFEIKGPRTFSEEDFNEFQETLIADVGLPLKLYVRARVESVLGTAEPMAFEDLLQSLMERTIAAHPEEYDELLKGSR